MAMEFDFSEVLRRMVEAKASDVHLSPRFRVNCFFQRGSVSAAFRLVPQEIPGLDSLGVPPVLRDLTAKPRGFVLVTGPTGSGKSTTLAAMIDVINTERPD